MSRPISFAVLLRAAIDDVQDLIPCVPHAQGLALPGLSKQGQMPAFFRMLEGGMLDEPLFSIWLSPDPTTEPAGKILFGGHNPQRYIGDLVDLPVISRK